MNKQGVFSDTNINVCGILDIENDNIFIEVNGEAVSLVSLITGLNGEDICITVKHQKETLSE